MQCDRCWQRATGETKLIRKISNQSDGFAIGSLWIGQRLQPARRGAGEQDRHGFAGRGMQAMLGRLAHDMRPEGVRDDQAGIGRKNLARHLHRGREEQPVANTATAALASSTVLIVEVIVLLLTLKSSPHDGTWRRDAAKEGLHLADANTTV